MFHNTYYVAWHAQSNVINISMTVANLYPDINPSLLLDFANVKALDPRITFTRASGAVYYDGVTTAKAEENLLLRSEEFDNAAWAKTNVAVSGVNTIVAPDGTTTAEEVRDGTASGIHNLFQQLSVTSGVTYVLSCFLKNVDRQFAVVAASTGVAAYASMKVDLVAGTVTASQALGSGWAVTSAAITDVGSGWYRCVLVFVPGSTATGTLRIGTATDGTTFSSSGSGLESYTGTDLKIAAWGAQLEQRASVTAYTPTTTQPITNYVPVLQAAGNNVARFDHDPVTGGSLGLLIEEQRTNLALRSEEFDNAYWTKGNSTVTPNAIVAPDGALTSDKLVENTATSAHLIRGTIGFAANTTYTVSIYLKAAERTAGTFLVLDNTSNIGSFHINLLTGEIAQGGVGLATSATSVNVGNGWWRMSITFTTTASPDAGSYFDFRMSDRWPVTSNVGMSYTGDGFSGIYIWGAQLEVGSFPTSYIKTEASQVTRLADSASMTGTNFSSWYRQDEGSLVYNAQSFSTLADSTALAIDDGTTGQANQIDLRYSSGVSYRWRIRSSGANTAEINPGSFAVGQLNTLASSYKVNDFAAAINGAAAVTATSGNTPLGVMTRMRLNQRGTANVGGQSYIRKLAYYPQRLTNTQLQALTNL
jgi:hypothetical protein